MTQCGTPGYVAPEIVKGIPYGTKVDMWSLGVILYILIAGYPPFNGKTQKDLFRMIRRGKYQFHEQFWGGVSDEAKDLVSHLLVVEPKSRYSATDALSSDWMLSDMVSKQTDLRGSLLAFRKFNAKRKVKQAVLAVRLLDVAIFAVICTITRCILIVVYLLLSSAFGGEEDGPLRRSWYRSHFYVQRT